MNRIVLKPNSARGVSIGVLFNEKENQLSSKSSGLWRNFVKHRTAGAREKHSLHIFKLTIDGRQ